MFLTKLILNGVPSAKDVRRDLGNPYEMHRTLTRAFYNNKGEPGRILFRLEPQSDSSPPVVLVQSEKQPDWSPLHQIPGYLLEAMTKELKLTFRPGQQLRFRLRANPTVRQPQELGPSKRVGLGKIEDQCSWLERKAAACGFKLLTVTTRNSRRISIRAKDRQQVHQSVDFEGVLEVIDPSAFLMALLAGIGAAKGLGFGLLSVAPA